MTSPGHSSRRSFAPNGGIRDEDGYASLRSYAGTGDGRSLALVALDGTVDWWAVPDLDAVPAFAALLDPAHGGRLVLRPTDAYAVQRGYVGDTNVLATTFTTATGSVRVTDSLNTGVAGRLPWTELARRVEGVTGHVALEWSVEPGSSLNTLSPWAERHRGCVLIHEGDLVLGVVWQGLGEAAVSDRAVAGEAVIAAGDRALLGVVAGRGEPLFVPQADVIDARVDRTLQGWQTWSDAVSWKGPWRQDVLRSLLALKLLVYAPTGAVAAAATIALPERVGGDKNWDYRYTWVRDTAYTLDAFVRSGMTEEVHAALAWLLSTVQRHGSRLRPFYTLQGGLPSGSAHRDVPGWRRSAPVVHGNRADGQLQLGPYGDLFQTVYLCVENGHVLDLETARLLEDLANRCCDEWQQPDAGMWELPDERHFTLSKMSCWQALDRAARLAERGELAVDGARWRREADRIVRWVGEHCWSAERGAYLMAADGDELDAGVLLGARYGFDLGSRMASTAQVVLNELGEGPWLYRYSGMRDEEAAFLACTFWAVEALALTGRTTGARRLMQEALDALRGTWLLSEMIDPKTGEFLGNLPQALSHLALVNAASAVREAERGIEGP